MKLSRKTKAYIKVWLELPGSIGHFYCPFTATKKDGELCNIIFPDTLPATARASGARNPNPCRYSCPCGELGLAHVIKIAKQLIM